MTTAPTYLHPDLLGSPRKATAQNEAVLWSEHVDQHPFTFDRYRASTPFPRMV